MPAIDELIYKECFDKEDVVSLLSAGEKDRNAIHRKAAEIKKAFVSNKVYFRALIEYSNYCVKNCFYCGICSGNLRYARCETTEDEVLQAARYAWENRFASIALQSGERNDGKFISKTEQLIGDIQAMVRNELHITLSLGGRKPEIYC